MRLANAETSVVLPLVSIVITNFNYARFLAAAVNSVWRQTYPNIECVIVDDASTDGSATEIEKIASARPETKIVINKNNSGQTFSSYAGFVASRGEFILFLDADDILLDNAVATHVFVHLSSRVHAGFTTCDMLQTLDDRVMTGASFPQPCATRIGSSGHGLLRRIDSATSGVWPSAIAMPNTIEDRVCYLAVADAARKFFAPTSGNCFRRDALALFLDDESPMSLRLNTDVYIREAIFLFTGAIAIDLPLFVYRVHGGNGFTKYPDLLNRRTICPASDLMTRKIANRAIADRLAGKASFFLANFGYPVFREALQALLIDVAIAAPSDSDAFALYLFERLKANAEAIRPHCAPAEFARLFDRPSYASTGPNNRPQKLAAEFLRTAGKALRSSYLSALGERLWRA